MRGIVDLLTVQVTMIQLSVATIEVGKYVCCSVNMCFLVVFCAYAICSKDEILEIIQVVLKD